MSPADPGRRLRRLWDRLRGLPGGRRLFDRLLWRMVPYSGTVRPRVRILEPGHARVELRDRRGVRNHLGSIHAVALCNLGELTGGLAVTTALPPGVRGIVVSLTMTYERKARGRLVAEARTTLSPITGPTEHRVDAEIRDESGEVVARASVLWRLDLR